MKKRLVIIAAIAAAAGYAAAMFRRKKYAFVSKAGLEHGDCDLDDEYFDPDEDDDIDPDDNVYMNEAMRTLFRKRMEEYRRQ